MGGRGGVVCQGDQVVVWDLAAAARAVAGAEGWEGPLRPDLVGHVSAFPVGTRNPASGECRVRRENVRNVVPR